MDGQLINLHGCMSMGLRLVPYKLRKRGSSRKTFCSGAAAAPWQPRPIRKWCKQLGTVIASQRARASLVSGHTPTSRNSQPAFRIPHSANRIHHHHHNILP